MSAIDIWRLECSGDRAYRRSCRVPEVLVANAWRIRGPPRTAVEPRRRGVEAAWEALPTALRKVINFYLLLDIGKALELSVSYNNVKQAG